MSEGLKVVSMTSVIYFLAVQMSEGLKVVSMTNYSNSQ